MGFFRTFPTKLTKVLGIYYTLLAGCTISPNSIIHHQISQKNNLQNTQHVALRYRPTLSIGKERLACLNNPRGVQLGTLAQHAAGHGVRAPGPRALFFSPLSLPSSFGRCTKGTEWLACLNNPRGVQL